MHLASSREEIGIISVNKAPSSVGRTLHGREKLGIRSFRMGGSVAMLNGMAWKGLTEKMTCEQRFEDDQALNHGRSG